MGHMRQREVAAREAAATLFRPRRSGGRRAGRRVVGRRWKDKKARKKDCLEVEDAGESLNYSVKKLNEKS